MTHISTLPSSLSPLWPRWNRWTLSDSCSLWLCLSHSLYFSLCHVPRHPREWIIRVDTFPRKTDRREGWGDGAGRESEHRQMGEGRLEFKATHCHASTFFGESLLCSQARRGNCRLHVKTRICSRVKRRAVVFFLTCFVGISDRQKSVVPLS